jgi:hypothetical protein
MDLAGCRCTLRDPCRFYPAAALLKPAFRPGAVVVCGPVMLARGLSLQTGVEALLRLEDQVERRRSGRARLHGGDPLRRARFLALPTGLAIG